MLPFNYPVSVSQAIDLPYDNTSSGLAATDVQDAIDEIVSGSSGTDVNAIHKNVAAEISVITEKAVPIAADLVLIEDSADTNKKKRAQLGNLAVTDSGALHKATAGEIHAISDKVSPVAADELLIEDSADTWKKKRVPVSAIGGSVVSVFGRTAAVLAAASDYDANQVDYDHTSSGLVATNVQTAIDEVVTDIGGTSYSVTAVGGESYLEITGLNILPGEQWQAQIFAKPTTGAANLWIYCDDGAGTTDTTKGDYFALRRYATTSGPGSADGSGPYLVYIDSGNPSSTCFVTLAIDPTTNLFSYCSDIIRNAVLTTNQAWEGGVGNKAIAQSPAKITKLRVTIDTTTFAAGSTFTLMKVAKGAKGAKGDTGAPGTGALQLIGESVLLAETGNISLTSISVVGPAELLLTLSGIGGSVAANTCRLFVETDYTDENYTQANVVDTAAGAPFSGRIEISITSSGMITGVSRGTSTPGVSFGPYYWSKTAALGSATLTAIHLSTPSGPPSGNGTQFAAGCRIRLYKYLA